MAKLVWDEVGTRRFETGLDRGVLYPLAGAPVEWNGLIGVTEEAKSTVKEFFIDGVKYLDHSVPSAFSGKIQAFTYPDILDELTGVTSMAAGIRFHEQMAGRFHLSYRTLVGDDVEGTNRGYKLHILYNLLAVPSGTTSATMGREANANVFEWTLLATPAIASGVRPTSHISIDSTQIDPSLLEQLEDALYGTDVTPPEMLTLQEILTLASAVV